MVEPNLTEVGYSASVTRGSSPGRHRTSHVVLLVVLVAALLLLAGQFPRGHPLVPRLHFSLPTSLGNASPSTTATPPPRPPRFGLTIPRLGVVGSTLALHGHTPTAGTVTVFGSYGGRIWKVIATARAPVGSYLIRLHPSRRGLLHLRALASNGSWVVGSIHVHKRHD